MTHWLTDRTYRTWLLLVLLTVAAFGISDHTEWARYAGVATIAIAYLKGRWVVLDFMELRHAPALWRSLMEAWLLGISVAITGVYLSGITPGVAP